MMDLCNNGLCSGIHKHRTQPELKGPLRERTKLPLLLTTHMKSPLAWREGGLWRHLVGLFPKSESSMRWGGEEMAKVRKVRSSHKPGYIKICRIIRIVSTQDCNSECSPRFAVLFSTRGGPLRLLLLVPYPPALTSSGWPVRGLVRPS